MCLGVSASRPAIRAADRCLRPDVIAYASLADAEDQRVSQPRCVLEKPRRPSWLTDPNHPKNPRDDDHKKDDKQSQEQKQDQDQKQDQHQSQWQFAVQDLKSENENKNENDNDNKNSNENKNENENKVENEVDNKLENKVDNDVDNKVSNEVKNEVKTDVETKVDVDVSIDLDLDSLPTDDDLIDIEYFNADDNEGIVQALANNVWQDVDGKGNDNAFNIQQVNSLVDNDYLNSPEVKYDADHVDGKMDDKFDDGNIGAASFIQQAFADGGEAKMDDAKAETEIGNISGTGTTTADAIVNQEAFTQNIVQGANIQFNSNEISVVGDDATDAIL
ncbi:hypothetical protein AUC71_13135 [Methyloceanibacter marginalis]|uniref:Uncharacterized protein n=1 Tax=Methyloceanibacter marginalis TaxID=1774971 RepID=A0A1E3WAJ3_9HYPH|nr:hypothetical protein AUC71_13135 [Methyloceanibacter marginalis]